MEAQRKAQTVIKQLGVSIGPHLRVNQTNTITTENMEMVLEKKDASSFGANDSISLGDFNLPSLPPSLLNLTKPVLQEVRFFKYN